MARQTSKARTTEPKEVQDRDVSKPWPTTVEGGVLNVKRKWQELFQKRMRMKFMHAVECVDNLTGAHYSKDFDGNDVDEYDVVVNLLAVYYESEGATFDFTDDEAFGLGWGDLIGLLRGGDGNPKGSES